MNDKPASFPKNASEIHEARSSDVSSEALLCASMNTPPCKCWHPPTFRRLGVAGHTGIGQSLGADGGQTSFSLS